MEFVLKGNYSIANWQELDEVLSCLKPGTKVKYNDNQVDEGMMIVLEAFNANALNKHHDFFENAPVVLPGKQQLRQRYGAKDDEIKYRRKDALLSFFDYAFGFGKYLLRYVAEVVSFAQILKKRPKHDFQKQIMIHDITNNCYTMGVQALPIVIFLSFAIGVIVALQSATQLRAFGSALYAIDLVIFSFFKEMALLVAIIVLAARSGSGMISKIGIMRISDEWNALNVRGLDPDIFLLQPKIFAMICLMPFLGYVACVAGILGGYVVLHSMLDIGLNFLIGALRQIVSFKLFFSILFKGLFFGLVVGLICAMEARGISLNSEKVVLGITRGVVYSICACILLDMLFNLFAVGWFS